MITYFNRKAPICNSVTVLFFMKGQYLLLDDQNRQRHT